MFSCCTPNHWELCLWYDTHSEAEGSASWKPHETCQQSLPPPWWLHPSLSILLLLRLHWATQSSQHLSGCAGWENAFLPHIPCQSSSRGPIKAPEVHEYKLLTGKSPLPWYPTASTIVDALGAHQKQAVDKNQWQHYLRYVPLGYQFMTYFPVFHCRRRNAREIINDRSIIINILGSCNTRTLWTQLNWTSKTFYMFWFFKNK